MNFRTIATTTLVLLLGPFVSVAADKPEVVSVWTYDTSPPFVVDLDKKTGLSYDFADLLSLKSEGKYKFVIDLLPRQRVDLSLSNNEQGVVLWVNNAWFDDADKSKYLWTSALIKGSASVVSPASAPVEYTSPESLSGMDLVGVRGHRYVGVDDLIASGEIQRNDVASEENLMHFISSARADVAIVANVPASYYAASLGIADKIHFSKVPHSYFDRFALVTPSAKQVYEFIETQVVGLENDPLWRGLLTKYGLSGKEHSRPE